MLTDEFAEKVASIILEKLQAKKLVKAPKEPRVKKLCSAEKNLLHSLALASKETWNGAEEWRWRDVHAETYNMTRGHLRMVFYRYRDSLVSRGLVTFDGSNYCLGVTSGAPKNVSNVTNAPLP